ncbi:hypothetical protein DFH06DRAFT_1211099 [Mycena polygramma]|nr:hypothetical protein DFH06DRAFT_1211099 [Mycena polygramma]
MAPAALCTPPGHMHAILRLTAPPYPPSPCSPFPPHPHPPFYLPMPTPMPTPSRPSLSSQTRTSPLWRKKTPPGIRGGPTPTFPRLPCRACRLCPSSSPPQPQPIICAHHPPDAKEPGCEEHRLPLKCLFTLLRTSVSSASASASACVSPTRVPLPPLQAPSETRVGEEDDGNEEENTWIDEDDNTIVQDPCLLPPPCYSTPL